MSAPRILVIDDEVHMLRTVERVLKGKYDVRIAATPEEAHTASKEFEPQLAIIDIRMPDRDGFTLMGELRRERPELDVIFMTGAVHEIDSTLIRAIREKAFYFIQKPFDREVLLTIVERCLELRRLADENRAYVDTLERELEAAVHFQRSLLPVADAALGTLRFAGAYEPCDDLGGDIYDWEDAGDGRLAFMIADVAGHGVTAAMLTGIVKSAFHAAQAESFAPVSVTRRVAAAMRAFPPEKFVTLFCARLDPKEGRLEYVNAGHPAPLLRSSDGSLSELTLTGPIVSPVFADIARDEESVAMGPGSVLLLYTDGLSEARGESGLYGEERLRDHFAAQSARGDELLASLQAAIEEFTAGRPADDDRTLATIWVQD